MKMRRIYSAFLFVLALVFLVACVDDKKEMYIVTFDSNGGTTVESVELEEGSKIPEPTPAPQFAGHNFEGWFEGDDKFDFVTRVIEGDLTLVAKWSKADTIPPAFVGAINGVLPALEHLKGEEIDLEQGIRVRDETTKEEDVVLRVSDFGGYNKDIPGEYTIVFEAEDEAGNTSQAERVVVVRDILVKEYNALVINGENAEYEFNRSDALIYTSSGTNFRIFDIIQVMDKEFFIASYNEHKDDHTNNGGIPFFPNGVLLIVDEDMKVQHIRIAAGALIQINADGQLEEDALTWTNGVDAVNGGGLFKGLIDELDTIIPNGGYLMFVGNTAPEVSRKFLIKNLFYSGYEGGAVTLENFDIDVLELSIELKEVREEIAVPDKLPAPQLTLEEDLLSWGAIANAEKYEIYIDGKLKLTVTTPSISLNSLELDITETAPYKIEVVAVTSDIYSWSTSDKSEAIDYIQKETIDAPILSIHASALSWDAVTGAISYDIYINFAGQEVKLDNVEETTYDLSKVGIEYAGNVDVLVVAVSDENHYDSVKSDAVKVFIGKVETLVIDGYSADVIKTTAHNYFTRRNTNYQEDISGFANSPYLYLITDIFEITKDEFTANATEAFSVVVLFDKDANLKFVNNIMPGQTYTVDQGWHKDDFYVNNNAQLVNIKSHLAEGDMLLIGKNGNMVNVLLEDETVVENVNARHLIAHIVVKNNESNNINGEAWRGDMSSFLDPKDITFEVVDRIIIEPKPDPEENNIDYISINDETIEVSFNWDEALKSGSSGTTFRSKDIIQVMDKEFFIASYNEHKDGHTNNGLIPYFPNGVLLIVDEDMKVQHIRIAAGALIQINADGQLEDGTLTWTNSVDAVNGGGLFKGLIDELDTIIPNGGYLMFVGNTAPEIGRASC